MFDLVKHFLKDPFNDKALGEALDLILALQAENARLHNVTTPAVSPEYKKPEPPKPFRVRWSMRDRRAKKEASLNKVYRNIAALNDAMTKGEFDVSEQNRKDLRQPGIRQGDGPGGILSLQARCEEKEGCLYEE